MPSNRFPVKKDYSFGLWKVDLSQPSDSCIEENVSYHLFSLISSIYSRIQPENLWDLDDFVKKKKGNITEF